MYDEVCEASWLQMVKSTLRPKARNAAQCGVKPEDPWCCLCHVLDM